MAGSKPKFPKPEPRRPGDPNPIVFGPLAVADKIILELREELQNAHLANGRLAAQVEKVVKWNSALGAKVTRIDNALDKVRAAFEDDRER